MDFADAAPVNPVCTTNAAGDSTCTGGTTATPLVIYDKAAGVQPPANGSNNYPVTTYNQNPPTTFVTIDPTATLAVTTTSATRQSALADNGIIAANFSNTENPAVNNVVVNNSGTVALTTNQIQTRNHAIVTDSQVNSFTVNNLAGGTISATQNYAPFLAFNKNLLTVTPSATVPPAPPTYSARYAGNTLAIVSAIYSDDNTNTFVLNNSSNVTATGRYAAGYYGRAAATINNSGTLGNAGWAATDKIYDGHWAIGSFAGANFATVPGSNPDVPIYDVQNVTLVNGVNQGTLAVTGTATTTVSNSGTINGDILALDTNPLVYAAAMASGQDPSTLASSGTNSGPRDSVINNSGTINGSFYLGSGAHQVTNSGSIAGSINVDQRSSVGAFAAAVPGTAPGTYSSVGPGGRDSNGNACPATNSNTSDPYCARTRTVRATFVGAQTFSLKNTGSIAGDITINDQPGAVNDITLRGTGFAGNVIAMNGTGTNTLTLNGVTNLQSVQNFTNLNLRRSNVTVANGVSLVDGATIQTNIYGAGGNRAAPSTKLGTINGQLTLQGATTIVPTFATLVRNGGIYQLASAVTAAGPVTVQQGGSALVKVKADTSDGRLLLETQVRNANTISGLNQPARATLNALLTYRGNSPQVRALGGLIESFGSLATVRAAANALAPNTNGVDIQTPVNNAMLFHQQIDSRLDQFLYGELPTSGRSADLGVPRPVYAVVPANGAWAEAIGGGVHQSTVDQVRGYNAELEGVIGGYDRLIVPGFRVGAAFGYIDTRINNGANQGSREDIQTYQGLAYAAYEGQHAYLRGSAGYGGVDFQGVRRINFATFSDTAFGTHSGNIFTARGEGGVPYQFRNSLLVPYAAFTYSHLNQGAYSEQSALGTAFSYRSASNDSDRSEIGGKVIVPLGGAPVFSYLFPVGSIVALEGRAAYVHEFGRVAQTVSASFAGGGDVFIASGPVPNRDMVDYGVGLRMASGPVQIDLSYNGLARTSYLQQVGLLRARYLF